MYGIFGINHNKLMHNMAPLRKMKRENIIQR